MQSSVAKCSHLNEYFQSALLSALDNQRVEVDECTAYYLVNLLSHYARAEHLFVDSPEGPVLPALANHYATAQQAVSEQQRTGTLRQLGDLALFIAGFFADSLARKAIDVDYYIAMGGAAYDTLHSESRRRASVLALNAIFGELAVNFPALVDVFAEIGEDRRRFSNRDVLRLYEVWLASGSRQALKQLQRLGITPPKLHRTH